MTPFEMQNSATEVPGATEVLSRVVIVEKSSVVGGLVVVVEKVGGVV